MDKSAVLDILRSTQEIPNSGVLSLADNGVHTVARMFYGSSSHEIPISELAAARLGVALADLSWTDADSKASKTLLEEFRMASEAVNLVLTCFSKSETFGDGHRLMTKLSEVSSVPVVKIADDVYDWQSALAHLVGFQEHLGDLPGRQLVVSWGFGSHFVHPTTAHSLVLAGLYSGLNVRVVSPPEFSIMNRVRRQASKIASKDKISFEKSDDFEPSFSDADAVFAANWLRLDDYNHPERHPTSARSYTDWHFTPGTLPKDCVFSTEPPLENPLLVSDELMHDPRNVSSSWLARRVRVLMASMLHALK
ncbi:hypothetical protein EU524_00010 [Candidatus Thorarchaeota archaeon]|nr:MAG: hypothetical protein EU524_00010 [Candidatus Thorarchaeota archaeon]